MSFAKVLDAPQHPVLAILGGISKSYKLKTPGLIRLFAYHVFHIMHLVYIAYYIYIYIYTYCEGARRTAASGARNPRRYLRLFSYYVSHIRF